MIIAMMVTAATTTTAAVTVVIAWKVKISMLFLYASLIITLRQFACYCCCFWLTENSDPSDICCRQMKTIHQNVNKHIDTIQKKIVDWHSQLCRFYTGKKWACKPTNEWASSRKHVQRTRYTTTTLSNAKWLNNNTALPPVTRCEPKMNFV